ncbi:hypothetical protein GCM10009613_54590 [Pseudonocardia kongjuensis]|uniref:Uncharacterized protein n=1 Tax=Pseudonocardia kongjuensis TaxID=102227 RepID=A0ABN1Y8I0_9PSEU
MSTDSEKTTATEQSARAESDYPEQSNESPRSKPSHPCITIRGAGPASGLPATPTPAAEHWAVRPVAVARWSRC